MFFYYTFLIYGFTNVNVAISLQIFAGIQVAIVILLFGHKTHFSPKALKIYVTGTPEQGCPADLHLHNNYHP